MGNGGSDDSVGQLFKGEKCHFLALVLSHLCTKVLCLINSYDK